MKKILIIEDDQIVSNIYRNKYQVAGYIVEAALNGEAGLKLVEEFKPDIIQLDLMLPKLNGVEVIKKIRANPETKTLPILVVSNSYLANLVRDAWQAGATKCISKSECNPKLMLDIIEKMQNPVTPAPAQPPGGQGGTGFFYAPGGVMPPSGGTAFFVAVPAPGTGTPGAPGQGQQADALFQEEIRQTFHKESPQTVIALRNLLHKFVKTDQMDARSAALIDLLRKIRSLSSNAAMSGLNRVAKLSVALEALLKELNDKPETITPSSLRTVTQTIDQLAAMMERSHKPDSAAPPSPNILVVDDEVISRRAVVHALDKAGLKCMSIDNPQTALSMLTENKFDLIFLDLDMPVMNGLELCQKLRTLPAHQKTPVVFVTGLTDFDSRAKSTLAGGNDFIAKPFIFMELAVKALTQLARAENT